MEPTLVSTTQQLEAFYARNWNGLFLLPDVAQVIIYTHVKLFWLCSAMEKEDGQKYYRSTMYRRFRHVQLLDLRSCVHTKLQDQCLATPRNGSWVISALFNANSLMHHLLICNTRPLFENGTVTEDRKGSMLKSYLFPRSPIALHTCLFNILSLFFTT